METNSVTSDSPSVLTENSPPRLCFPSKEHRVRGAVSTGMQSYSQASAHLSLSRWHGRLSQTLTVFGSIMKKSVSRMAPLSLSSNLATAALACMSLGLAGCLDGGDGKTAQPTTNAGQVGALVAQPTMGLGSRSFFVDSNRGGFGQNLNIQGVFWGRLVNVTDSTDALQHVDYVVSEGLISNVNYEVTANPVTEVTTLKIKHPAGSAAYIAALDAADNNLIPIQRKSLSPNELPPFSLAPRNAAIVIQFDDLLGFYFDEGLDTVSAADDRWLDFDGGNLINGAGQINSNSFQVLVGNPPTNSFSTRVFPDPNHGDRADFDGDGRAEFFPTRIVIDTTTSEIEAASVLPAILSPNSLGLPPAVTTQLPNIAVRIPTQQSGAVTTPLRNPSSPLHTIAQSTLENIDFASSTLDAVRALRSGGNTEITGDVNNGFMSDDLAPRLVGSQQVTIANLAPDPVAGPEFFRLSMTYDINDCSTTPKVGDVLRQLGTFAEVTESPGPPNSLGTVNNLQVRVIFPLGGTLIEVPSLFLTTYDPILDATTLPCFVRFSPPADPNLPPGQGVSPAAQVTLRFTEAMDPSSLLPFDTMTLSRSPFDTDPGPFDIMVGEVIPSPDLREFTYVPSLPMQHTAGQTEDYFLRLTPGVDGATDLAGNALADALPEISFTMDANATTEQTGGVVLRFSEASELDNEPDPMTPTRELTGQVLFDTNLGRILSRPVSRTSIPADRSQPTPSIMTAFPGGVQTPLSPLGSKMQTLWRYIDLGMGASDSTTFNIDVEGISWSPASGAALFDFYDEFEIRLAHSRFQPDEVLDAFGFPMWPNSGLGKNYSTNVLTPQISPLQVVHSRDLGYVVTPGDQYTNETGTAMMPYPLNRTGPVSEYTYYTWRDTSILGLGGPSGAGVPLNIEEQVLGPLDPIAPANQVPSSALPLLMEFRCYPRDGAQGLNGFEIALAVGSSSVPNFRAFSTGGVSVGMNTITRNPDLQTQATGGFNPGSTPPGQQTRGVDNSYYIGQLDIVTRVSRAYTIWFDLPNLVTDFAVTSPNYMAPVLDPRPEDLPEGTDLTVDFRGASLVTGDILFDAQGGLDAYGNPQGAGAVTFVGGSTWKPSISQIDGSRFFQMRFTFVSNTETGLTPTLSALGVAFQQ